MAPSPRNGALEVDVDERRIIKIGDKWYRDLNIVMNPDWVQRIRDGYMCLNCFEPLASAFPPKCNLCGYAVKAEQSADFEREYKGVEHLGTNSTIDQQYEYSRELRKEEEAKARARKVGIVVP